MNWMSGSLDANAVRQTIFHNPSLKNYHIIIFNQNQRNTKTNLPNFSNFTLLGPLEFTYCLEVGPGMASASSNALSITSSSTLLDSKGHRQTTSGGSPQCVTLPTLPPLPVQTQTRPSKTTAYCKSHCHICHFIFIYVCIYQTLDNEWSRKKMVFNPDLNSGPLWF